MPIPFGEYLFQAMTYADDREATARGWKEIVRCKDCKYWGEEPYKNGCKYMTYIVCENDYCSNAERKEH